MGFVSNQTKTKDLLDLVVSKLKDKVIESKIDLGDAVVRLSRDGLRESFRLLKGDEDLDLNYLVDITVVDWMDSREDRFEVIYHLLGIETLYRLRIKVSVPEDDCRVESVTPLWKGADFMEREAWDMFGVKFEGHPDLRRILTYDEFQGHPLRKDYPVQAKQPRIPLLNPEVRNTAVDMYRPPLVNIGKRRKGSTVAVSPEEHGVLPHRGR